MTTAANTTTLCVAPETAGSTAGTPATASAKLTQASQDVQIVRGGQSQPAQAGGQLLMGDTIVVPAGAHAQAVITDANAPRRSTTHSVPHYCERFLTMFPQGNK